MVLEIHEIGKFVKINDFKCDPFTSEKISFVISCFPSFKIVDWEIEEYLEDNSRCFIDPLQTTRGKNDNWKDILDKIDFDEDSGMKENKVHQIEILGYIRG